MQGQRDWRCSNEEERASARERTDHGWAVVQEFWAMMEEKKAGGLKGRLSARKERKAWRENVGSPIPNG